MGSDRCAIEALTGQVRCCFMCLKFHKKRGPVEMGPVVADIGGGAEGDRTPGLMTASHALSQLSYSPKSKSAS